MDKQQEAKTVTPPNPRNTDAVSKVASNDYLITEILLKLPISSILRFKLITKHWRSLITSHYFCRRHNPPPNPARGILWGSEFSHALGYLYIPLHPDADKLQHLFQVGFAKDHSNCSILHSCNGFLLCYTSESWISFYSEYVIPNKDYALHVYNPTINTFATVPGYPTGSPIGAALAFDPAKSPHYKVILVLVTDIDECLERRSCVIQVYSSETRIWSVGREMPVKYCDVINFKFPVYWNGSVHWLNKRRSRTNWNVSLRFCVETGRWGNMPPPPFVPEGNNWDNYYFGESCNHLHFVEPVLPKFNVYEMKRDYSEWFVRYKVDLSAFCAQHREVFVNGLIQYICVVSLIRDKNGEDAKFVLRIPKHIVKVNVVDGSYEEPVLYKYWIDIPVKNWSDGTYRYYTQMAVDYVQSLCCV